MIIPSQRNHPLVAPALYVGCGLLVVVFVNLFPLFRLVSEQFGKTAVLVVPILLPLAVLAAVALRRRRHGWSHPPRRRPWLIAGLILVLLALALPDPRFAVKRIHVAEYLLLSLVVRSALARQLDGTPLALFSCLLSAVYGVHDELLQGLHPLRTYGLRDMLVNMTASAGGSLLWHGLGLVDGDRAGVSPQPFWRPAQYCHLLWLVFAITALTVPLTIYRHGPMPWWPFLPLAASLVAWTCLLWQDDPPLRHGLTPLSWVAFPLLAYPLLVNGLQIPFN